MASHSLHENALRRSRNPNRGCRGSVWRKAETMDTRRDHSRFEHGFHRQHGGECRSACAPGQLSRNGSGCAMGGRVLRIVSQCPDSGRRIAGRPIWPPSDLRRWCGDFRRGLRGLRPGFEHPSIDHREKHSRGGSCTPRPGEPGDYQYLI